MVGGKHLAFAAVASAVITLSFSTVANAAVITQSDLKLKSGVADVGTTVVLNLEGTVGREVVALAPGIRVRPTFDVEQNCRSESNPAVMQVARVTTSFVVISVVFVVIDPGHGQRLRWTATMNYDPVRDFITHPSEGGPTICPVGFLPTTPLVVTHAIVRLWFTSGGPPLATQRGEFLMIVLDLPSGHTELKPNSPIDPVF
jgi:hypothetical protein